MSRLFELRRNAHGRLVLHLADGSEHVGVTPVRAFPIAAPDEGLSLVGPEGKELIWIERLADLPAPARALVEDDLRVRELVPEIRRIVSVSSFSTPSTWQVETDRGATSFVLKGEEDIRRLAERTQLRISASDGLQLRIPDLRQLDKTSRKLLERFL
ncbi:DUF1854 domain-containing protein [Comamonas flocculans]|uniref:DUF1854 domain-containing protein n=1 Tax=Comamonas flocculans TaxID=2597701 RepID=A0A5B8RV09_9BURK|nr:DUF1854 domain-containing protein [Comamonas flocculans]QEA13361.1 DUF1854 domain-containing protein [Comamonas flocculans]